ncbi:MAG: DUF4276 family protein [Chromatiaceae bacterium]|nr:DUF4276 family protein [Chromatiaceae bacterium]
MTAPVLGLIFECGPQGADKQVCEYLIQHLKPEAKLRSRTLDNKANLLRDAGRVAAQLFKDGCSCVLILWDLRPAWPNKKDKPCRREECNALLARLSEAGIANPDRLHLICIEQELESWLLANERAVSAFLSTPAHPYKMPRVRNPDRVKQPKAKMIEHFGAARGWRYVDSVHAIRLIQADSVDIKRLRRSASFTRFEVKLQSCGVD